jgi:hypothetical protein
MKNILLIAAIVLFPAITQSSSPYIGWVDYIRVNNIFIKSTLPLKKQEVKSIELIYKNSKYLFFNEFENIKCNESNLGRLDIGLISPNILRNKKYFLNALETNFGRYFAKTNELYIIHDFVNNPEYLAHELGHYYYDECNVDQPNHNKVYKFQYLYKRRVK